MVVAKTILLCASQTDADRTRHGVRLGVERLDGAKADRNGTRNRPDLRLDVTFRRTECRQVRAVGGASCNASRCRAWTGSERGASVSQIFVRSADVDYAEVESTFDRVAAVRLANRREVLMPIDCTADPGSAAHAAPLERHRIHGWVGSER